MMMRCILWNDLFRRCVIHIKIHQPINEVFSWIWFQTSSAWYIKLKLSFGHAFQHQLVWSWSPRWINQIPLAVITIILILFISILIAENWQKSLIKCIPHYGAISLISHFLQRNSWTKIYRVIIRWHVSSILYRLKTLVLSPPVKATHWAYDDRILYVWFRFRLRTLWTLKTLFWVLTSGSPN